MKTLLACLFGAAVLVPMNVHGAVFKFVVPLSGANEFPGPGDADGSGVATLLIDSTALTIDWNIVVNDIELPPTGAHIHQGTAGVAGPVRIDFNSQLSGTGLVDSDLAGVLANPTGWYVNVHNASFRSGAIRGQLPVPDSSTGFGGLAATLGLAWIQYRRGRR